MGGEIQVESAAGKGSTFRVLLPASTDAETPHRPTPVAVPRGKRGRVLVVDDEPLVGTSLRRSLEEEHEVVVATSAREALGRLAGGERYDVILCDVMMPDITGYELYEELFNYAPDQARRMIFLTGGAFTPKARDFLRNIQNKRVDKPFDIERVRGLVRLMVK
jgi:CheY-like chemotaxis protein